MGIKAYVCLHTIKELGVLKSRRLFLYYHFLKFNLEAPKSYIYLRGNCVHLTHTQKKYVKGCKWVFAVLITNEYCCLYFIIW